VTTNLVGITPWGTRHHGRTTARPTRWAAYRGDPMSSPAPDPHDPDAGAPTGRSTESGRRRGRLLIPGIFIGVILLLVLFMLLVSQIGQ